MTTAAAASMYLAEHLAEWSGKGYAKFNPQDKPIETLPVIYAFSNVRGGGDGVCYAMAEDGTVLGSHYCSNEAYEPHDLGVVEGSREDRHEHYQKHYPDGYRMDFVRSHEIEAGHDALKAAFALNAKQDPEATA